MCGITGLYNFNNDSRVQEKELVKMRDSLRHRGPDSEGIFISQNGKVGLGHRRLAIIDLSPAGAQPMANEDGAIQIVFNGEIYNFRQIREELLKKGHTFRSKTDTEVIIHSYEEYGPECVKKFNGMFAFALWDEKKQIIFAARDHLGIKPFYYAVQGGSFYFGSEIKAILNHPDFKKNLSEENIPLYLTFSSLPAPHTLFRDIKKLPAARHLTIDKNGNVIEKEYWNPLLQTAYSDYELENEDFCVNEIRRLLTDSIQSQMVSDVPFGCFLSGGIDSSINAALMSRALGSPVETFSIGIRDFEKYNEFQHSRNIASRLRARTHEIIVGREDLLNFLPQYGFYADDPNGDQICFLVFYLSRMTRKNGVVVAQVGEGSDEIFAGYDTYQIALNLYEKIWRYAEKLPSPIKKFPISLTSRFFSSPRFDFQNSYLERLALNQEPYWGNAIAFSDYQKKNLLSESFKKRIPNFAGYRIIKSCYEEVDDLKPQADFLTRMIYLELKIRLPELLLARVDKMAMAHSIETRVPFLDHRIVELSLNIPQRLKLKNNTAKYTLKKAARGIIPDEIIDRKKQGFGAPIAEWLRDPKTSDDLLKIIKKSKIQERNILNRDAVENLIETHKKGLADRNFQIWNLITLSLWHDFWFA